jgi:hypothetical protein
MGRLPTSERPRSLSLRTGAVRISLSWPPWGAAKPNSPARLSVGSPGTLFRRMVDGTLPAVVVVLSGDTPDCGNGTGAKTWDEARFFV